jgi:mannose-6-phosphate isomerase-like protein (cupin superfamily)
MTGRYRVNWKDVPEEPNLREDEGWVRMRVQFALGEKAGSDRLTLGRTLLPPGARHDPHSHPNCDEFLFVVRGRGAIYTDEGEEPAGEDDVIFTQAGHVHGFNNTSDEDVLLLWGWSGAGSLDAAGYELHGHR